MNRYSKQNPLPIVILISGHGSNLQAIIDAIAKDLPAKICAVISNRMDAFGLERARLANIRTLVLLATDYPDKIAYDQALQNCIDEFQPKLIILAGFMRILGENFVKHFRGRLLNIHPSLLPKHRGLHTHQRVLEAGDKEHGVSVHFVTEELDAGPLIAQVEIPVASEDTVATLKEKIHQIEHRLYPEVIRWFAEENLELKDHQVWKNGKLLLQTKLNKDFIDPLIF